MNLLRNSLQSILRPLPVAAALGLLLSTIAALPRQARAQAVPAATWPAGDTSPEEQPLPGQMLGTDLTLNQGVSAINAENQPFNHYLLSLEASGGAQTNFFGTRTDQMTVGYTEFSAAGGLQLHTSRTLYYALYTPQYYVYPQFTQVNSYDQRFYQSLEHAFTEHTVFGWSATAGRYLSLNQYLPQSLNIGGIGITVPTIGQALFDESFQITNAATSLRLRHLINGRWTSTSSATAGYFLLVPTDRVFSGGYGQRFISSGVDTRLGYQLTSKDSIGGSLTVLYFDGLLPRGHATVETPLIYYERQLSAVLKVRGGAGPLFVQTSGLNRGSFTHTATNEVNYAVEGSISRQVRQSQFSAGYSRAFIVSYLGPALIAHQASFSGYIPFSRKWVLTSAATYTNESSAHYGGVLFGGSAQVAYLLRSNLRLHGEYSLLHENFSSSIPGAYDFNRNKFGAGIQFTFGSPNTPGGVQ